MIARDLSDSQSTNFVNRVVLRRSDHARPISSVAQTHFSLLLWVKHLSALRRHPQGTATSSERRLASSNTNCQRTWLPAFEHGVRTPKRSRPKSQHPSSVVRDRNDALLGCYLSLKEIRSWRRGGAEEDRTPDPLRARQVLSQLSYGPIYLAPILLGYLITTSATFGLLLPLRYAIRRSSAESGGSGWT